MAVFTISYDLVSPGQNYDDLIKAIKSYGTWCHALKSCWYIVASKTSAEIRDGLLKHMDKNDKILVSKIASSPNQDSAWYGLDKEITDWLKRNL